MKHFTSVLILFFMVLTASAQSISGVVVDVEGNKLPFATVSIHEGASGSLLTQKISDEGGRFQLNLDTVGVFKVVVSLIGYSTFTQRIELKAGNLHLDVPLEKVSEMLAEVAIVGRQKSIVRKIDRIVMQVDNNPTAVGKSALELFKMAPGVFVNRDNIAINGVSGTQILVNGRKLALSGADLMTFLGNLKSNEIESIEIIAHPSAEFEASGSGGIINIKLKKARQDGWGGHVSFDYRVGKFASYNPSTSLNYKRDKLELSFNYYYNKDKSFIELKQLRELPDNGIFSPENYTISRQSSHNARIEGSYSFSKWSDLSFYVTNNWIDSKDDAVSTSKIVYPVADKNSYSYGDFPTHTNSRQPSYGLNYNLKLDSAGSQIKVLVDVMKFKKNASSAVFSRTENLNGALLSDTSYVFNYPNVSHIVTSEAVYDKHISTAWAFKTGVKLSLTSIDNDNFYSIFKNSTWSSSPQNDFQYLYKENIYAGFFNLNGQLKNHTFQLGLRAEQSAIDGNLTAIAQDTAIRSKYINFFPSLFYRRPFGGDSGQLSFAYNRRIQRPSFMELNPFKYYIDNFTQQQGNPFLKPEISDNLEGSAQYKDLVLSLGYSRAKNIISTVIETNASSPLMTISSQNAGTNKVWNSTIAYAFKFTNWWQSSSNLMLTYSRANSPNFDLSVKSFFFQTQQDFNLSKTVDLSLSAFYTPRVLEGNIITARIANVDAGVNVKLLNKKLLLRAAVSDIFYTNNFDAKSYYNNAVLEVSQKTQSRRFSVSMVYNFSFGKAFTKKEISTSNVEEGGRLGK